MTFLLRILLGSAVYVLIIVLAAPFPSAAGLMLVFPTLNGLAFVFSARRHVLAMVPSMLWMPVVNGALCAGYLMIFLVLAPRLSSVPLAWGLAVLAAAAFALVVSSPRLRAGIMPRHQFAFAVGAALIGLVLVAAAAAVIPAPAPGVGISALAESHGAALSWPFALETAQRNGWKIGVFAFCLAAFLAAARFLPLSDGVRGVLAGLPLAPLGGLLSVASDTGVALAVRLDIMRQMMTSIWLGPAIAIWFIYAFPRLLVRLAPGQARAVAALFAAWMACGAVVVAASAALH